MSNKKELTICMGSACHQLGVYEVLPQLQKLLLQHGLLDHIELKGAFCLGPCSDGIVFHFQNQTFTHILPDTVHEKFMAELLPAIQSSLSGEEPSVE